MYHPELNTKQLTAQMKAFYKVVFKDLLHQNKNLCKMILNIPVCKSPIHKRKFGCHDGVTKDATKGDYIHLQNKF